MNSLHLMARVLSACVLTTLLVSCGGDGGSSGEKGLGSNTPPAVINGVPVPADPGPAASSTIVGVDANADGVRDEVERALAKSYGADRTRYPVAMALARSLQTVLQQPPDILAPSAKSVIQAQHDAFRCAAQKAGLQPATQISSEVNLRTFNTKDRMRERRRIEQSAGAFEIQATGGATC